MTEPSIAEMIARIRSTPRVTGGDIMDMAAIVERQQAQIEALLDWAEELAPPYVDLPRQADHPAKPSDGVLEFEAWWAAHHNGSPFHAAQYAWVEAQRLERERYEREELPRKLAEERERLARLVAETFENVEAVVAYILRGAKP